MMLLGGFGFLMTFLKRYGFSAVGLTFLVTAVVTEWSILLWGFTKMDDKFRINITYLELVTFFLLNIFLRVKWITFFSVLEGGLTAASVLISLGAVLGKLNPLQVPYFYLSSSLAIEYYITFFILKNPKFSDNYLKEILGCV